MKRKSKVKGKGKIENNSMKISCLDLFFLNTSQVNWFLFKPVTPSDMLVFHKL